MKAMYITPQMDILHVSTSSLMDSQAISGPEGMKDGGQASSSEVVPKAPGRHFF